MSKDNIKNIVLNQLADQVLSSIAESDKNPNNDRLIGYSDSEELPKDKGKVTGSCNRTSCLAPNSAFFYNHSTNAFYCATCASAINQANSRSEYVIKQLGHPLCTKIYAPIDFYDDGTMLITSYFKQHIKYCIDIRPSSQDTDKFMLVYLGAHMDDADCMLLEPSQYSEFIAHLQIQCTNLVNYVEITQQEQLVQVLTICDSVIATLTLLDDLAQYLINI